MKDETKLLIALAIICGTILALRLPVLMLEARKVVTVTESVSACEGIFRTPAKTTTTVTEYRRE